MTWQAKTRQRLQVIMALQKRDARATLYAQGIYAVMAISLAAAAIVLRQGVSALQESTLLIASQPLLGPAVIYIQVISAYLAISSSVAIARDRDRGTLELLLYGPVDYLSYVLGKFVSQMACYGVSLIFLLLYVGLISMTARLALTMSVLYLAIYSLFASACVASLGLLLSSLSSNVRRSLLIVIGVLALFVALEFSYNAVVSMQIQDPASPLLYFRDAMSFIYRVAGFVSPFAALNRGVSAISVASPRLYGLQILWSLLYTGGLLGAATAILARKGVR